MQMFSIAAALILFLGSDITMTVLAAPSILHEMADQQEPSVLTIRVAVVGTTAFITFIVLIICLFLVVQRGIHVPLGSRRRRTFRVRMPRTSTSLTRVTPAERMGLGGIVAGVFEGEGGNNQRALVVVPPRALKAGHVRMYEDSPTSLSSVPLPLPLEYDATDASDDADLRA